MIELYFEINNLHFGEPMTEQTIKAIEAILAKDDRVELIPMPGGGVKVIRIRRDVVKTK